MSTNAISVIHVGGVRELGEYGEFEGGEGSYGIKRPLKYLSSKSSTVFQRERVVKVLKFLFTKSVLRRSKVPNMRLRLELYLRPR